MHGQRKSAFIKHSSEQLIMIIIGLLHVFTQHLQHQCHSESRPW